MHTIIWSSYKSNNLLLPQASFRNKLSQPYSDPNDMISWTAFHTYSDDITSAAACFQKLSPPKVNAISSSRRRKNQKPYITFFNKVTTKKEWDQVIKEVYIHDKDKKVKSRDNICERRSNARSLSLLCIPNSKSDYWELIVSGKCYFSVDSLIDCLGSECQTLIRNNLTLSFNKFNIKL